MFKKIALVLTLLACTNVTLSSQMASTSSSAKRAKQNPRFTPEEQAEQNEKAFKNIANLPADIRPLVVNYTQDILSQLKHLKIYGKKLKGHEDRVNSAVFSPDGKLIVTASNDRTARIWDAATGNELHILQGHQGWVRSAVFSPDGKLIVTASSDRTARIWDVATGDELRILQGHQFSVRSAMFSPDGKLIVTASYDNTARIWDVATGNELHILQGHQGTVDSAVFSPDGKLIVTASNDETARIWDVATGNELHILQGHEGEVNSAVFSPDGKLIVTASADKTARIWDVATGNELHILQGHQGWVNSAVFSPDGKLIVTASVDKTARIWNVATGNELHILQGHQGGVYSAVFSPDGRKIVTASSDKTARIWTLLFENLSFDKMRLLFLIDDYYDKLIKHNPAQKHHVLKLIAARQRVHRKELQEKLPSLENDKAAYAKAQEQIVFMEKSSTLEGLRTLLHAFSPAEQRAIVKSYEIAPQDFGDTKEMEEETKAEIEEE